MDLVLLPGAALGALSQRADLSRGCTIRWGGGAIELVSPILSTIGSRTSVCAVTSYINDKLIMTRVCVCVYVLGGIGW